MFYLSFKWVLEAQKNKPGKQPQPLEVLNQKEAMKTAEDYAKRAHEGIRKAYFYDAEKFPLRDTTAVILDGNKAEIGSVTVTQTGHILHDLKNL